MPELPRIVVAHRLPAPALHLLAGAADAWVSPHARPLAADELRAAVAGADVVVTLLHDRVDEAMLDAAGPQLRGVANVAAGYDNVDVAAATRRGVIVTNTPGVLAEATADLALGLILGVTRRLGEGERLIRAQRPWAWRMSFMVGMGLQGKTLGVVGLGQIGQATAQRARAFGMRIVYSGRRSATPEVESALGGAVRLPLEELLGVADVVSLHCPLRPETHHLIDRHRLALMRPGAYLVNTSRGPIVDEAALVDALRAGTIAGAALDVFENEPAVHPGLLTLDQVMLAPHLGSATVQTRTAMAVLAVRNALQMAEGSPPLNPVNAVGLLP